MNYHFKFVQFLPLITFRWLICFLSVTAMIGAESVQPTVQDELAALRKENAVLKAENQQLRRLLSEQPNRPANPPAKPTTPAQPATPGPAAVEKADAALTYWLTTSSSKRHNNRCRYYQTTKGRACSGTEGTPCKVCGG